MTYTCDSKYNYYYQEYEFTAFSEADLLRNGDTDLGCGDTFVMPSFATTCITVKDDDGFLSGDACWNENADDSTGQTATIMGPDGEEGNGGQIYAESYFWVYDQHGNWYVMIEIEQEGGSGDYFTFHNAYGIPPAGSVLTISSQCNVTSNWIDYKCLGGGEKVVPGTISGTVFCDIDCDGVNGQEVVIEGCDYVIEAEHMYKWGFVTAYSSTASGGKIVKLGCNGGDGDLSTYFSGKDGVYDVKIRVQDECDGRSTIYFKVDGKLVEAVRLDRDSDGYGNDNGGFSTFVIKDVDINNGQKIQMWVDGDQGEFVRIDKITLIGHDQIVKSDEPGKAGVTVKLVDLDGNVVATTTTDADGNYKFDAVAPGQYKIMGVAPDGTEFTIQDAGSDDSVDSDVDANGLSGVITVTSGSSTDIDLGVCEKPPLGSLSGRYFCDENNNDIDDGGAEPGIAGVLVELLDGAGNGTGITTTTDANGNYRFDGLEAGTYGVKFTYAGDKTLVDANVGNDDTIDSDATDIGGGMSVINGIVVVAGEESADNDAGVETVPGSLSGRYFCDENNNDIDDGGAEPGIAGVLVELLDGAGNGTGITTTTDANGNYSFANLAPGTYGVKFTYAGDKTLVDPNVGNDDTVDSDATDIGGGMSVINGIIVVAGQDTPDNDAGVEDPGTAALGDLVFFDVNKNGIQDDGELGVEGVEVKLLDADGNVIRTTTTNADGNYLFTMLQAATYSVMFGAVPGYAFTLTDIGDDGKDSDANAGGMTGQYVLAIGETNLSVDAGIVELNVPPIAADDSAMVCVGQKTIVDLLANDSDANVLDTLSVLTIQDADETAGVGGTITLASGATATLNADGTVLIDATNALPDLLIGEMAMDEFQYTLSDGQETAGANVDLTLKGALNTLDTLSTDLGEAGCVTATLTFDNAIGGDLYTLDVTVVEFPDTRLGEILAQNDPFNLVFCLSITTPIALDPTSNDFTVDVLDADSYAAAIAGATVVNIPDLGFNPENADNVNWLLNEAEGLLANGYTEGELQRAIWNLVDGGDDNVLNSTALNGYFDARPWFGTFDRAQELTTMALANDGFVAQSGDIVGVIFDPKIDGVQPLVAGIEFDLLQEYCICEDNFI